jgi:hypothetical protein
MRKFLVLGASAALLVALSGCSLLSNVLGGGNPNGEDDVFALKVGDCFNKSSVEQTDEITSIPIVECKTLHDYEVYSAPKVDHPEFPGAEEISDEADSLCIEDFESFLGMSYDEAFNAYLYDYSTLYPTSDSWKSGDREIICAIIATDDDGKLEQVKGSLEGAEG